MTKTNQIYIESRFTLASSCITVTLSLPSMPSYTPISTGSYTVLPHLFGFLLVEFQYLEKRYVDVLLSAAVQARAVEGAVIIDSDSEPIDTSSNLNSLSFGEIPYWGTLKVTLNKSFHIFKNFYLSKSSRMEHLRARTSFDVLYNYRRKKCIKHSLLKQSEKWRSGKNKRLPIHDILILKFWIDSTTALHGFLSHPSQRRRFVANHRLANDENSPF